MWARALCEGGVAVVPVGEGETQILVRATRRDGVFHEEGSGEVRYVRARRSSELSPAPPARDTATRGARALRVLGSDGSRKV